MMRWETPVAHSGIYFPGPVSVEYSIQRSEVEWQAGQEQLLEGSLLGLTLSPFASEIARN